MNDHEGQQLAEGNSETPNSPASGGNVQPSSETVNIPKTEWESIQKTIKRLDDETRSNKDRAVKRTNERLDEFEEKFQSTFDRVYALMQEHGITKESALNVVKQQDEDAETKRMIRELYNKGGALPTNSTSGNVAASGGKVAEVVKEFGLDENDAEVVDIYKRYSNPDEAEKAVLRLAARRSNPTPPSISAAPILQGNPNGVRLSEQEVENLSRQRNLLFKEPTKNREQIKQIEKRLIDAGIPID